MVKYIKVTKVNRELKPYAQDKVDKFATKAIKDMFSNETKVDENGKTREYYENLGIPVPDTFNNSKEDYIELDLEKDYEVFNSILYLKEGIVDEIQFIEDKIYLCYSSPLEDYRIEVAETQQEIQKLFKL